MNILNIREPNVSIIISEEFTLHLQDLSLAHFLQELANFKANFVAEVMMFFFFKKFFVRIALFDKLAVVYI